MISIRKFVGTSVTILIALTILSISILRCATPKIAYEATSYAYSPMVLSEEISSEKDEDANSLTVDYLLAYQGKIGPDSIFWYGKVVRDKVWYFLTFSKEKKLELNLLFADKRLNSALELFKENKPDLGLSTLTKAEKYLEMAVPNNADNIEFLKKLALASLKHREVIEGQILPLSPEDVAPNVNRVNDYSKETYKKARDFIYSKGQIPPVNIFELK